MAHIPVLLQEVLSGLNPQKGDVFVDATLGGAGHSSQICQALGKKIQIIGIDADETSARKSETRLVKEGCNAKVIVGNFRNIDTLLENAGQKEADKILFDLGWNAEQLEESGRGFSFQRDEPLLMTYQAHPSEKDLTAREILNDWEEKNIEIILENYGEERFAKKIARAIVERRERKPFETTLELAETVREATPVFYQRRKINPATKTFQALRITTNDEIGALKIGLEKAFNLLRPEGRVAVITFHSVEDRIVKNFFRQKYQQKLCLRITKKPLTPSRQEIDENSRSRSAKLRIIEKI